VFVLVNVSTAVNETPSHGYGVSLVICHRVTQCYLSPDTSEHTVALTPARQAGTRFTYARGIEG